MAPRARSRASSTAIFAPWAEIRAALGEVGQALPGALRTASFADRYGRELARTALERQVPTAQLAADVSAAPWFLGALDLPPGSVLHTEPYRSSSGEWVVTTATWVGDASGERAGLVRFDMTLDSLRRDSTGSGLSWGIMDGRTGRILVDSDRPIPNTSPDLIAYAASHPLATPLAQQRENGVATLADQRVGLEPRARAGREPRTSGSSPLPRRL